MASKDQENLGRFFYEPEQAAQVTGVQQKNQTPMTSDQSGMSSGLQLGSGLNAPMLDVGLMAGLGGSLDVFAGTVERAPKIWQDLNLEWLYRCIKEPWRFKRIAKLPLFIVKAWAKRIRKFFNGKG